MTFYERLLIYVLLITILIMTAITYRHVAGQGQELEARIEHLSESLEREVRYRKDLRQDVMEMFNDYWRESNGE